MERIALWAVVVCLAAVPSAALAEPPRVHFDMPFAVACREVTPDDFARLHPGYKLIEARLEISSLLVAGQERDLTQYFVRVESQQRTLTIVDYLPKTRHESLASAVTQQTSTEKVLALGINLSGKYELLALPGPSMGFGEKKTSSVKTDLLPPLETVAASGTLARGGSVFFKIKSTPRNLLEGTREYALVLSVPAAWRADCLRVRCEAEGIRRGMVSSFDETIGCGQREFLVALYQDGDEGARSIAENFARREAAKVPVPRTNAATRPGDSAMRWPLELSPAWAAAKR